MEENTTYTTDRISMLPDSIIHHILSYLLDDPKSRVRMSVLSKEWFALTASFPILYFRQDRPLVHLWSVDEGAIMKKFCKYVQYTVSRFCKQNISARILDISTNIINLEQRELFGRCLDLVLRKGLQEMRIYVYYYSENAPMLRLPKELLSTSSLTSLTLIRCELPSPLMVGGVELKSLRLLSLSYLRIDEGVIEYLTKGCPILEEICLRFCYGSKTFCVKRHHNLQKVKIYCDRTVLLERIDVEAPNLSCFRLVSNKDKAPSMFLGTCKKLTTFCYSGSPFKRFNDFLSDFPFLENVSLDLSSPVDNLKLSNHSLKKIGLQSECNLGEIDLNAPNLLLFEYYDRFYGTHIELFSRKHSSMSKGCMNCVVTHDSLDILWCQKFRQFLEKNSVFKALKLVIFSDIIDVEEVKLIHSPPYELEHVEIIYWFNISELSVHVAAVDVVLWCCRPQSLTLELHHYIDAGHVVKYTYEKLLQQENEGQTNIKFVLISSSNNKQHFSDLNSLLQRLYISLDQVKGEEFSDGSKSKITFIRKKLSKKQDNEVCKL